MNSEGQTTTPPTVTSTDGRKLLAEHPAIVMTVGYLVISLLGMSYEWVQFRFFSINFFHYADVADFLMGAFREPITFVLFLTALATGWLVHIYNRWELDWFARHPATSWLGRTYFALVSSRSYRATPAIFFIGYSVMFIWVYSYNRAEALREGEGDTIRVEVVEGQRRRPSVDTPTLILGTSSRFVFLYRPGVGVTEIIPLENIARIVIDSDEARQNSTQLTGPAY